MTGSAGGNTAPEVHAFKLSVVAQHDVMRDSDVPRRPISRVACGRARSSTTAETRGQPMRRIPENLPRAWGSRDEIHMSFAPPREPPV